MDSSTLSMVHGNCIETEQSSVFVLFPVLMFVYLLYFYRDVHAVCLWDDKGPAKIHQALKEDILEFIKQAQAVSFASIYCLRLYSENIIFSDFECRAS